jgi:transposase InsO family protein
LIRDRDSIYGKYFKDRVKNMDIKEVLISYKSPWQNPFVERITGSIRRECLDHIIVIIEKHLRSVLKEYKQYYNSMRPHLSLNRNSSIPRKAESLEEVGDVKSTPILDGLHHFYSRAA